MTLRYDNHGRPIGLDWTVCRNDEIVLKEKKSTATQNPGVGRGQLTRLAREIEDQIIDMYTKSQMTAYAIARAFGITHKTVYRVLGRNDVPTRSLSQAMVLSHARRSQE